MLVKLPPVMSIALKVRSNEIRQLACEPEDLDLRPIPYTFHKVKGLVFHDASDTPALYVFPKKPTGVELSPDVLVLQAHYGPMEGEEIDLTHGAWLQHPSIASESSRRAQASLAIASWDDGFYFVEENPEQDVLGLRKPQLGALHAIHAHWSTSTETATVVMPTGTGKTETMLATLISAQCKRVLVVVPTDALREQISKKFESLGVLKLPRNRVLAESVMRPVVGTLHSKPKDLEQLRDFFQFCNVVVTTSALIATCSDEFQQEIAECCSHLFIDEAHHSEARTWQIFRQSFYGKFVLQFTATPFREDGRKIDGKLIYVYPLRLAQEEGYFRPIRLRLVTEFDIRKSDLVIAQEAVAELDSDTTGKHIVMARVATMLRAEEILKLYQALGRDDAVAIYSQQSKALQAEAKQKLYAGIARIVVCVDMLGEGFDLPELKIAAFHDIRKSLAVTLQLAGRFTRGRSDLGDPVFIANTALIDVREELQQLYLQDADWNQLLPALSAGAIEAEVKSQEFFRGFGAFIEEVPIKDLRPAASMVIYKTACTVWRPDEFRKGLKGLSASDRIVSTLNVSENTLVVLTASDEPVRWTDIQTVREMVWELIVAVWDSERSLLYIHGSGNDGEYSAMAKALCGTSVELVVAPDLFRCFQAIKRLVLNNVGLDQHLGRQVRYTVRMGSDVESRIGHSERQGAKRSVLAGVGFERGHRTSVGAAKRGRVWSNLRLRVDTFAAWAREIGAKVSDENLNADEILAGTLKPKPVGVLPETMPIAADWPKELLERVETGVFFLTDISEVSATYVDLEVVSNGADGNLRIRVYCDAWEVLFRLDLFESNSSFDFAFVQEAGPSLSIRSGRKPAAVQDFFSESPPIVWFADGSSLEGCEYTELPSTGLMAFDRERLQVQNWDGVDISKESQGENRNPSTIQYRIIEVLKANPRYVVIFDDDGSGEAADVVAVSVVEENGRERIEVALYHLKYSSSPPGARVDDLYVVCGQAQRSTVWLMTHNNRIALFTHLLKREAQRTARGGSTRFEKGDAEILNKIRVMSRMVDVRLQVFLVQPGLSKRLASPAQLTLLAVAERYLSDTYEIAFQVICSA